MLDPSYDKSNKYIGKQPYGLLVKNIDRKLEKLH